MKLKIGESSLLDLAAKVNGFYCLKIFGPFIFVENLLIFAFLVFLRFWSSVEDATRLLSNSSCVFFHSHKK